VIPARDRPNQASDETEAHASTGCDERVRIGPERDQATFAVGLAGGRDEGHRLADDRVVQGGSSVLCDSQACRLTDEVWPMPSFEVLGLLAVASISGVFR
jgi:hypothetical protein